MNASRRPYGNRFASTRDWKGAVERNHARLGRSGAHDRLEHVEVRRLDLVDVDRRRILGHHLVHIGQLRLSCLTGRKEGRKGGGLKNHNIVIAVDRGG